MPASTSRSGRGEWRGFQGPLDLPRLLDWSRPLCRYLFLFYSWALLLLLALSLFGWCLFPTHTSPSSLVHPHGQGDIHLSSRVFRQSAGAFSFQTRRRHYRSNYTALASRLIGVQLVPRGSRIFIRPPHIDLPANPAGPGLQPRPSPAGWTGEKRTGRYNTTRHLCSGQFLVSTTLLFTSNADLFCLTQSDRPLSHSLGGKK